MLSLPLKQTERVDLSKSLYRFVEATYSVEQADEHRDAFAEVSTLREDTENAMTEERMQARQGDETTRHEVADLASHQIANASEKLKMELRQSERGQAAHVDNLKSMIEQQIQVAEGRAREFRVYEAKLHLTLS